MATESESPDIVVGTVKWFDAAKGYGFVTSEAYEHDILLHANVLRNFGVGSVCDRARVRISVQRTARGLQTHEVLDVWPPEDADIPTLGEESIFAPLDLSIPLQPARVKWFDKIKGFGFANIFGKPEDVFLHMETLRRSGMADLQPGEAVGLRSVTGERGWMAVSIEPWESGLSERGDGRELM